MPWPAQSPKKLERPAPDLRKAYSDWRSRPPAQYTDLPHEAEVASRTTWPRHQRLWRWQPPGSLTSRFSKRESAISSLNWALAAEPWNQALPSP